MPSERRPTSSSHDAGRGYSAAQRAAAFCVHILTASGAVFALLALMAAVRGNWSRMFLWLVVALLIDAVDGNLARRVNVADKLPQWSGERLDSVVDFTTYVFVPAYAMAASGLLPQGAALALGALIVVTGALYFADRRMKTADNYFRGFPVLWNIVAFYLFLLEPPPWIGAASIALLMVLTFLPFHFVHPVRVRRWRAINIAMLLLWSALGVAAIVQNMNPPSWVTLGLCAVAIYFLLVGLPRSAVDDGMPDV
jgi:phosphatidylcholine synthase